MATFAANLDLAECVGVSWGRQTSQKLLPSMIVELAMANGIEYVKLFSVNPGVMNAFYRTNLSILLTIPNNEFRQVNGSRNAKAWVKQNITDYMRMGGIRFKYVLIGNEPYSKLEYLDGDAELTQREDIVNSVKFIQDALNGAKIGDQVQTTVPHYVDVLKPNMIKPSEADFREDLKPDMVRILRHLHSSGAPFMVNLYPMLHLHEYGFPIGFGTYDRESNFTVSDGDIVYTNVFDLVFDMFVSALRKNGFPDMRVVAGQVGWPTDGDIYASVHNAEMFYKGFLKKLASKKGTPLQPGPLEAYLYSLADENNRNVARSPSDRHYGIYGYDGVPKFHIDFTLQGRKLILENATGISYMPRRWCVLKPEVQEVQPWMLSSFNVTCLFGDCSRLTYGSTCNGLDLKGNLSYAFNMFFQMKNQQEEFCNFNGSAKVVYVDPSTEKCKYYLQILSTVFVGGRGEMFMTLGNGAERTKGAFNFAMTFIVPLLLILYALSLGG
ncbi:hypothetical protein RJ639_015831 [Escallonia herrerae]|uniref:X8 domain-containing protein n=1 Tax=Escallonia herrerae TaxID=1293975 RepID=A0AA88VET3_9ASTE|nr:hypothetical protein RJ639_015831 [Escallonia herrerae]